MRFKQLTPKICQVEIDNPKTKNEKVCWINITNAGKDEVEYLRKKYKFDLSHLRSSLAHKQSLRPAIETGDGLSGRQAGYLFLILHFPAIIYDTIIPGEIEFFIGHGFIVTIHNNNLQPLNDFFNLCKKDGDSTLTFKYESSAILLYEILDRLMAGCFPLLDKSGLEINNIEEIIFGRLERESISRILHLRRNVLSFRKIMQNHKNILKKLMEMKSRIVPPEKIRSRYKKLVDDSIRVWEILENQKEMIDVYNSTYESLMNYRLSDIMKTLTIFSVIVFPLTLFATLFSMDVKGMPFSGHPQGFFIVLSGMFIITLGMLLFFERKKWL